MADEIELSAGERPAEEKSHPPGELIYESNRKHSEPWQTGAKGSLCKAEVRPLAQALLATSVDWEGKRYAVYEGRAYCAQEHDPNRWHGYPVGWVEVPPKLVRQLIREKKLTNHDRKRYWEGH